MDLRTAGRIPYTARIWNWYMDFVKRELGTLVGGYVWVHVLEEGR